MLRHFFGKAHANFDLCCVHLPCVREGLCVKRHRSRRIKTSVTMSIVRDVKERRCTLVKLPLQCAETFSLSELSRNLVIWRVNQFNLDGTPERESGSLFFLALMSTKKGILERQSTYPENMCSEMCHGRSKPASKIAARNTSKCTVHQ